ncbi:MAG: haloacid dehalogenase-like hydrolase [Desulfarculaceae bacterium]|nr:haloacid dehalogenase-like hydrolase [Desulfarculaceae bacterium]MCF8072506.1 haloacid dehalogenase-like hydrolase [Desulfarculaceae bacterium]MCF8103647.1 haloacid dehalogenase-like hydrolase [Desulfarculaceae bacterium]MCF8117047.1 haloacid dehalogenase-like hydrolase [Desulfarculaceae bacterium]
MRPVRRLRPLVLALLVLVLVPAAWAAEPPLASWNEPLRGRLMAFAAAAADPASPDFVPPVRRIASFDVDGTLIVERPLFFVLEVALARLDEVCPDYGQKGPGQRAQCQAAAKRDRGFLLHHLNGVLSQPFAGMTQAAYRELAARVWQQDQNPKLGLTVKDTAYQPMRELIALLLDKGFTVFLNSGSDSLALMAISRAWGLGWDTCIGSKYELEPREKGGKVVFARTGRLHPNNLNLGQAKAVALLRRTGRRPILAAGNSSGDVWMLRMASGGKPGLVLVINHDDPEEFVYSRPKLLAEAKDKGWHVVSMKRDWKRLFAPEK